MEEIKQTTEYFCVLFWIICVPLAERAILIMGGMTLLKIGLHFLGKKGSCSRDSSVRNAENESGGC